MTHENGRACLRAHRLLRKRIMKATLAYTLLFVLTLLSLAPATLAQQQQPSAPASQPMVVQPASAQVSLDGMGVRKYLLGPGDTLDVRVFGQPEMNWQGEVDSDGNLSSLPFVDKPIPAQCRTDKEVEKDIRARHGSQQSRPSARVRRFSGAAALADAAPHTPERSLRHLRRHQRALKWQDSDYTHDTRHVP
jgi:polysaccharide export outer membrane protein